MLQRCEVAAAWHGCGPFAGLVDEVNVVSFNRRLELREAVEPRFLRTPVELMQPVVCQSPDKGEARAVVLLVCIQRGRKARVTQTQLQVCNLAVRNVDLEVSQVHARIPLSRRVTPAGAGCPGVQALVRRLDMGSWHIVPLPFARPEWPSGLSLSPSCIARVTCA